MIQNPVWATGFNAVAIPLAAGALLNPVVGALFMTLSTITVAANAMLLRRIDLRSA